MSNSLHVAIKKTATTMIPKAEKVPGILEKVQPIFLKKPINLRPDIREVEQAVKSAGCRPFVPSVVVKDTVHFAQKVDRMNDIYEKQNVLMADGELRKLHSFFDHDRHRDRRPLKVELNGESKDRRSPSIARLKWQDRLFSEILHILHNSCEQKIFHQNVVRITRVESGPDLRLCIVRWTIDDELDRQEYGSRVGRIFERLSSKIRYQITRKLNLSTSPEVKFLEEDYGQNSVIL